jgi:hypothetical protein
MRARYISKGNVSYTASLDDVVIALCKDYGRREDIVNRSGCTERTAIEYRYLNYRIREAAEEIAGERYAMPFIEDIGKSIGYARTEMSGFCEADYKSTKRAVKLGIARSLHLLD